MNVGCSYYNTSYDQVGKNGRYYYVYSMIGRTSERNTWLSARIMVVFCMYHERNILVW
jgi:hypothetical protein